MRYGWMIGRKTVKKPIQQRLFLTNVSADTFHGMENIATLHGDGMKVEASTTDGKLFNLTIHLPVNKKRAIRAIRDIGKALGQLEHMI